MTISSTTVKNSYNGDNSTTTFNYTFKVFADSDLQVIIRSALGTETVKTLTTHYTVTGAGNANGGSVIFTAGNIPASGETVVIRRAVPQTQAIDYIANDPFPAESHEEGLDRAMMTLQQVQEELDRSIKISRTNTMTSTEFTVGAASRAGKILGFDDNGELVVSQELGTYAGDWTAGETYNARDIVKDTSNNNIYLCNTGHTASGTTPISSNADVAKWDLLVDAYSATASATAAAASAAAALVSENNSSTSESNALSHKNDAETAKTAAELAETNAETAQTAAEVAQAAAEAALDNFDDRFLGAKASDPTVDNDGDALTDGALYFNTTDNVMKVYDLGNTTWRQIQLSTSDQANVNTVAADLDGSNTIGTVAGSIANVNSVAGNATNINTVAGISSDVTSVAGISAAVSAVNSNSTNINAVNANSTNINTVAANNTNITNVGGSITNVNTVANNLADVNSFAETYRIDSSAPTTSLDIGDLYFDTTADELKVYKSSGWSAAGSSVNGTSARFTYNITGTPSSVTGADANGSTLAYDAGFADVYVNGVRMSSADITITSGTSVVFASALADGDVVDVVAYGTFNVAAIDASSITSGTLNIDRVADGSITNAKLATPFTLTSPTITSIAPDTVTNDASNIVITGTNFVITPNVEIISTTGAITLANTVTRDSATQLTINVTLPTDGTYFIRVENPDGLAVRSSTALLTVSDAPTWTTASGSLGSVAQGGAFSSTVVATSDSAITYSVQSGALPTGITLNTSTGVISGTESGSDTGETVYNFTLRATDVELQTADRAFSITVTVGINNGIQFN